MNPQIGMCFDRSFPAAAVTEFARRLEDGGAHQLWLIEDCFYTAGISLAAAALATTDQLQVGLGILPAVARNPAVTAMEIATLAGLGPGRVLAGIGHGVQDWMDQMGARSTSPLTALGEVIETVSRLLAGERVTFSGRHVHLDGVGLEQPPTPVPPVLAGVRGPRSLELAGRVAGGLVLADPGTPAHVRDALATAGRSGSGPDEFHVAVFSVLCIERDPRDAYRAMAPWLAGMLAGPNPGLTAMPCFDELVTWFDGRGVDGLVDMPAEWWHEIGPIGTLDDALAHLDALVDAGAHSIALFPSPDLSIARAQIDDVVVLAGELA